MLSVWGAECDSGHRDPPASPWDLQNQIHIPGQGHPRWAEVSGFPVLIKASLKSSFFFSSLANRLTLSSLNCIFY